MPLRAQISTVLTTATALFTGGQPYDLVDLATVKDELSIADSASDKFLSRVITQASLNAASYCNRVFVAETLKDEFWPQRDRSSVVGGVEPLQLTRWPVACPPCLAGIAAPTVPVLSHVAGGTLDTEAALIKEKIGKPGNDPTSKRMADRLPSISPERYRRA